MKRAARAGWPATGAPWPRRRCAGRATAPRRARLNVAVDGSSTTPSPCSASRRAFTRRRCRSLRSARLSSPASNNAAEGAKSEPSTSNAPPAPRPHPTVRRALSHRTAPRTLAQPTPRPATPTGQTRGYRSHPRQRRPRRHGTPRVPASRTRRRLAVLPGPRLSSGRREMDVHSWPPCSATRSATGGISVGGIGPPP